VHSALGNKTRLAALRVKDFCKRDVMVIHTLLRLAEIRDPDFPVRSGRDDTDGAAPAGRSRRKSRTVAR
jgi:non-homologous end joining protein Ku